MPRALPARTDPEMYAYLKYLLGRINKIDKAVGVDSDEGGDETGAFGFNPTPDTAAVIAGNGESEDTEDAWTTVSAGAPTGARFAKIRFRVSSTDNNDDGDLKWRTDSSGAESPIMAECVALEADAQEITFDWVTLTDGGTFDYKFTNTSATTIDWNITYCGYSL